MNKITYQNFNQNKQHILIKFFSGKFTVMDIINSWENEIISGILTKQHTGYILDYTNASLLMNLKSDITTLVGYMHSEPDYFENNKFAIIMHKPSQVTIPFVLERTLTTFHTKPFSSIDAGIQWILN